MSHQFDPGLILGVVAGMAALVVFAYTVKVNRLFHGLPTLQRPWHGMMIAVAFGIVSTFGTVARQYFHLGPAHPFGTPLGLITGLAEVGFVVALAYTVIAFHRAWTPQEVKA